jgi:hypothetical protein
MARLRKSKSTYKLPSGEPRGDAPGGVSTPTSPRGNRTGDMRYGYKSQYQLTPQGLQKRAAAQRYRRGKNVPAWRREAYQRS